LAVFHGVGVFVRAGRISRLTGRADPRSLGKLPGAGSVVALKRLGAQPHAHRAWAEGNR